VGGSFDFLDNSLASIRVIPGLRGPLPADLKKDTPIERKVQEYLVRDVLMKAQYRLALSLWKCGGGAWQSAMDIICEAESLPYFHDEDRLHFRELHNQILEDIGSVIEEEDVIRQFLKTKRGWTSHMLTNHKNAGIQGLLRSRFTRKRLEVYPWDNDSIVWTNEAEEIVDGLNEGMAGENVYPCHYTLKVKDDFYKEPILSLTADKSFDASEVVFAERSAMQVILPVSGLIHCNNCGALLDVPQDALDDAATLALNHGQQVLKHAIAQNLKRADRATTSSPSIIENPSNSAMNEISNGLEGITVEMKDEHSPKQYHGVDPHKSPAPPSTTKPSERQEGYQICHGCKKVAVCSLRCMDSAMRHSHHFQLCKTPVHANSYPISPPNVWPIPSPNYTVLLNRLVERTISFAMGGAPPLTQHWIQVLQTNLRGPREWPEDGDLDSDFFFREWNDTEPESIEERYPHRQTLAEIIHSFDEKERKDSKTDDGYSQVNDTGEGQFAPGSKNSSTQDAGSWSRLLHPSTWDTTPDLVECSGSDRKTPNTTPGIEKPLHPMMDWSFENNVRFPLRVLYESFRRDCSKKALHTMLDVTNFDGWMLETIRAKVEANMRIQSLPKLEMKFNDQGKVALRSNFEQPVVESAYGPPLFGSDSDQWMASLHPLCTGIKEAGQGETPNVKVFDQDGALVVSTIKRINVGDVLLR
jgi:hypothetical protein